ncbi:MAG: DUF4446 family protein [Tissierellia bacterium]|nr:DUF4446 family protein [Tissierellia bacterium]
MSKIIDSLSVNSGWIILGLIIAVIILLIMEWNNWQKINKLQALKRRLDRLVLVEEPITLGELLKSLNSEVKGLHEKHGELENTMKKITNAFDTTIVHFSLKRYDAFEDTGMNLSFSLCLLDINLNGIIITGINEASKGMIYSKVIVLGEAKDKLSPEEEFVLADAKSKT